MDPELAEAMTCRFTLGLARDEGLSKVIMASDFLSLIQRINSTAKNLSSVGTVVAGIKKIAASFLVCLFLMLSVSIMYQLTFLLGHVSNLLARSTMMSSWCISWKVSIMTSMSK
jgi:hypothetical protein